MTEKHTCCANVSKSTWFSSACGKNAKIERDGKWYCGTHDPVAKRAKQEAKDAEYHSKMMAQRARQRVMADEMTDIARRSAFYDDLLDALKQATRSLDWLAHGRCRGDCDTIPSAKDALEFADAVIKKTEVAR